MKFARKVQIYIIIIVFIINIIITIEIIFSGLSFWVFTMQLFVFFSSDEPILCYQRSSFFPLAEERRVSVTETVNEAFENDKQLKLGLKMGFTMLLILLYCAFRFCMFASIKFLPGHVVLTNLKVLLAIF